MPSPPFNPLQYQPLMPFFDVKCGSLQKIYDGPKIPLSMRISQNTNKAFEVSLNFIDASGVLVEQAFAKETTFQFQFGYLGTANYKSKWYQVIAAHIKSTGLSKFVSVTGLLVGEAKAMTSSNPSSGTIKEILDKLGKDHDIDITYKPELSATKMSDSGYNNNGDTDIQEKQHIKFSHESDKVFVDRILQYARDGQGKGGYIAVWGQNQDGKDILNIIIPDDSSDSLTYTYPSPDTPNVVDWQPEIDIMMGAINGSTGAQFNGVEQSTGNTFKLVPDPALTQQYQTTMGNPVSRPVVQSPDPGAPSEAIHRCSETMDESVVTNSIRTFPLAQATSMARANPALNYQLQAAQFNNQSRLILIGDPGIDENYIGKSFQMNAYLEKTYDENSSRSPHWSTGKWMINGFEHVWGPGQAQTSLLCNRIGSDGLLPGQDVSGSASSSGDGGPDTASTEVSGTVSVSSGGDNDSGF